ncbi:tail fiber protein [Escherichia coli]
MGADKTNNIMTLSSGVSQPLLADVQYFELYSSSALNRKLKNIVLPGFYCGFEPVPGTGLSVRITSENSEGKGAASVDVNNVQISVQQIEDVTVSVKAGATNIIVLEANFEHGVKTTQVDSASSVSAARIYARTDNTIGQNQIELCRVIVPSGATAVTKEMIVLKYRVNRAVGVEFSNEISSTEERKAATPLAVKTLHDLVDTKAPINSPNLTGTPTTPTAPQGTNNTQIASTAFVMAAIAALVDSSPDALNTLNELAAALGNDPNFATTMTNALAGKQPKDATLTALAGLATAADKFPYFTGNDVASLATLTKVGRDILAKSTVAAVIEYLGLQETVNRAGNAVQKNGDTLSGGLTFENDSILAWIRNTDWAKIGFKNDADGDTDSYMWFETGDNGNEYFKWRSRQSTTTKDLMTLKWDALNILVNAVINGSLGVGSTNALGGSSIVLGDNDTGFKQNGDGILDVYANSQRVFRFQNGVAIAFKNIQAGDGKKFTLSSSNNSTKNATFNLWGASTRPVVAELGDEAGWHFYSQRNTDNSVIFSVNGQIQPSNWGNFDSRYVKDVRLGTRVVQLMARGGRYEKAGHAITGLRIIGEVDGDDEAIFRPIQKYINGTWYNVAQV